MHNASTTTTFRCGGSALSCLEKAPTSHGMSHGMPGGWEFRQHTELASYKLTEKFSNFAQFVKQLDNSCAWNRKVLSSYLARCI